MKVLAVFKGKWMVFVRIVFLISMTIGCTKSDPTPNYPIKISFQLLNEIGEPSIIFKEGENFRFSFIISNFSEDDVRFSPSFIDDDFFIVYRMEELGNFSPVSKPYQNIFCEFSLNQFVISPQSEYQFEIPWSPEENFCCPPFCKITNNLPLPVGIYRTSINRTIEFIIEEKLILLKYDHLIEFEIF